MKLTQIVIAYSTLILYSCGSSLKKEYSDGQEVWNSVKGKDYDDIREVWGRPVEVIPYDDRVDISWSSSQVNVKEGNTDGEITLSFDKYLTIGGMYEGIGKPHDLDCGDWQYYKNSKMKIHRVKF